MRFDSNQTTGDKILLGGGKSINSGRIWPSCSPEFRCAYHHGSEGQIRVCARLYWSHPRKRYDECHCHTHSELTLLSPVLTLNSPLTTGSATLWAGHFYGGRHKLNISKEE